MKCDNIWKSSLVKSPVEYPGNPPTELDAVLVSRSIAEQLERRIAYRRAMKQSMFRTMQAGAKGIRILCSGRLAGAEIARRQLMHQGRVPLHTIRADVDYGLVKPIPQWAD